MNFKYMILADSEVIFATDDYEQALNEYAILVNAPDEEKVFMYECNLVINWKWALYTEQGVMTEGVFKP